MYLRLVTHVLAIGWPRPNAVWRAKQVSSDKTIRGLCRKRLQKDHCRVSYSQQSLQHGGKARTKKQAEANVVRYRNCARGNLTFNSLTTFGRLSLSQCRLWVHPCNSGMTQHLCVWAHTGHSPRPARGSVQGRKRLASGSSRDPPCQRHVNERTSFFEGEARGMWVNVSEFQS